MAAPWLNFPFDARVLLMQRMNVYTYTNVVYVYRKHIKSLYNTIILYVYICVYIYIFECNATIWTYSFFEAGNSVVFSYTILHIV